MKENAIHGATKKCREWRIALEGPHYAIMKNGSKLIGGGCMNENAIHGAPTRLGTSFIVQQRTPSNLKAANQRLHVIK